MNRVLRLAYDSGIQGWLCPFSQSLLHLLARQHARDLAATSHRESLKGMVPQYRFESRGRQVVNDDGMKIGDCRNCQLLPALQVARRNYMFQMVPVLDQDRFVKIVLC